jgi:hypothetical protein
MKESSFVRITESKMGNFSAVVGETRHEKHATSVGDSVQSWRYLNVRWTIPVGIV